MNPFRNVTPWRVAPVLLVLLCSACSRGGTEPGKEPQKGELKRREPTRVRVTPVVEREMVRVLQTTTVVESEKEIEVFPRASGVVTEVYAEEGDVVEAGQVLAVLDQREAQAMVDQARVAIAEVRDAIARAAILKREAESRIHQAKLAWDQSVRDYERNEKAALISQQALDAMRLARDTAASSHEDAKLALERSTIEAQAAETGLKKAELALERSELELSWTRITAPFAGVIARRGVRIGGTVGRGTSVIETAGAAFVLTDPHHLRAVFHRPQRELGWFLDASHAAVEGSDAAVVHARAVEIEATAEALPGVRFQGRIERVSPSIDAASGSFRVTVRLEPTVLADAGPENGPAPSDADARSSTREASLQAADAGTPSNGSLAIPRARARLLPGMLIRLQIVTDRHPKALVVPKRSLRREGELNLVFAVREGRTLRVEVEEGFSDDENVEILRSAGMSLVPGDLVVVVGNRELEDGSEVEIEAPAGAPSKASAPQEAIAPPESTDSAPEKKG